jgi:hypothetical protein
MEKNINLVNIPSPPFPIEKQNKDSSFFLFFFLFFSRRLRLSPFFDFITSTIPSCSTHMIPYHAGRELVRSHVMARALQKKWLTIYNPDEKRKRHSSQHRPYIATAMGGALHYHHILYHGTICTRPMDMQSDSALFLQMLAQDIQAGLHPTWQETVYHPYGRLALELDFVWPNEEVYPPKERTCQEQVMWIVRHAQTWLQQFGPQDWSCSIATTPVRAKDKEHMKMGAHVVFYMYRFEKAQHEQMIHYVYHQVKLMDPFCTVDSQVKKDFTNLRYLGCHKVVPCDACHHVEDYKERQECQLCEGQGKLLDPHVYQMKGHLDASGKDIPIPSSFLEQLRLCSIMSRSDQMVPDTYLSDEELKERELVTLVPESLRPPKRKHVFLSDEYRGETHHRRMQENLRQIEPYTVEIIQDLIHRRHVNYANVHVDVHVAQPSAKARKLSVDIPKEIAHRGYRTLFVNLQGDRGKNFCLVKEARDRLNMVTDHVAGYHHSNRVYFTLWFRFRTKEVILSLHCYDKECKKDSKVHDMVVPETDAQRIFPHLKNNIPPPMKYVHHNTSKNASNWSKYF